MATTAPATIRVDPEVYTRLLEHKGKMERSIGRVVSLSDAIRDLLHATNGRAAASKK